MSGKTGMELVGTVNHMKKNGTFYIVLFGLIAGFILLLLGGGSFFEKDGEKISASDDISELDAFEYKADIEREIRGLCMQLSGVSHAFVCVNVDGGEEILYAKNRQNISSDKEEYVIIGSGSNARPLYLGKKLPEICGIGIILKGNNISSYKNQLEAMLSAAYSIPLNKVYVQIN